MENKKCIFKNTSTKNDDCGFATLDKEIGQLRFFVLVMKIAIVMTMFLRD